MDEKTLSRCRERARIIKALAHPTRIFIVEALAEREHCVCELTTMIGADMSTVSRHLALLKSAGIIADDKRGLQVFYRLVTPCALGFIECVESILEGNLCMQSKVLSYKR